LIRSCARLFIGSGRFVFYLCAATESVIFDSRFAGVFLDNSRDRRERITAAFAGGMLIMCGVRGHGVGRI
jgi:hypothetical protein